MRILLVFLVILALPTCFCANILAIVPMPSYSHQVAFQPLWRELSLKGHKVTLITTDPQDDSSLTNLTEINIKWAYKYFGNFSKTVADSFNMWTAVDTFTDIFINISEGLLSYAPIQDLMQPKESFDVILVEAFFPEFLVFGEIYKCPKILISSMETFKFIHRLLGNPTHPVLNTDVITAFFGELTFKERVTSTVYDLYVPFNCYRNLFRRRNLILNEYFNTTITQNELISDVDLMFLNVNPVLDTPRALGPSTITIGGYPRITSNKLLPKDVQDFLDSAREGFIYFSLGSNVKSKDLKKDTLNAIIEALQEIPYKVLWKFEADELSGKPKNVMLIKWAPQQSVLSHPNIKLFVSQGGLQSMEESIFSEVPIVVVPFFADQDYNAKLMKSKGIAKIVTPRPYLNKEELKAAILEVIENPSYRRAVRRLKELTLDTPMTGLEKAVWWTEYVIRNKGAKHLRNPAADIPYYQYFLIDVISFLIFIVTALMYISYVSIKALIRFIYLRNAQVLKKNN